MGINPGVGPLRNHQLDGFVRGHSISHSGKEVREKLARKFGSKPNRGWFLLEGGSLHPTHSLHLSLWQPEAGALGPSRCAPRSLGACFWGGRKCCLGGVQILGLHVFGG